MSEPAAQGYLVAERLKMSDRAAKNRDAQSHISPKNKLDCKICWGSRCANSNARFVNTINRLI
jgi:hypothetical protein